MMKRHSLRKLTIALGLTTCLLSPVAPAFAKAVYGEWGVSLDQRDLSVKPGADFYMFANGKWDSATTIPADRAYFGIDSVISDQAEDDLHTIAESMEKAAPGTPDRKVGDLYASFMDEKAIEAKGIAPVQPMLAAIDAIATPADLATAFGAASKGFSASPVSFYIDTDAKDPQHYAVYFDQAGLGLPDRDYYLKTDPEYQAYRKAYHAYIEKLFTLAGIADGAAKADAIVALETKIAEVSWPVEDTRDTKKTYNVTSVADLEAKAPGIEWAALIKSAGLTAAPKLVKDEDTAIAKIAAIVAATPLDTWKTWLKFHLLSQAAPLLSKNFVDANFDFEHKTLSGQQEIRPRWKRAVALVDGSMGEAMGAAYVAKRFPPEAKAQALELVLNLKKALGELINDATWLDPKTKAAAHVKLDAMRQQIGYPDKWRDYSKLEIKPDDLVGNVIRASEFEWKRETDRIAGPVDKTEWGMTPQTVNAYNSFRDNQIVFPAAILQPPYFDPQADLAVNYGEIGATIGHEISHGFDDQGRLYDETGAIRDWWTAKDAAAYDAQAKKLVAQYNTYEPVKGLHINGQNTLGENIADLAGLTIAYRAYKIALGGKDAPVIDGLTGDQRFFLAYAQSWQGKERDDRLREQIASDPHSPNNARVNGVVRNFDPWYAAFDIKPGDPLYLTPEQRAKLW